MDQSDKNPNRRLGVIPKWSELCPDLLRSIFEQLSLTNLNRAKLVCRSWNSASRGCVPKRNQIPWLIVFPEKNENNSSNNCVLFVPDDKDKVYKTRDLGVDFAQSCCLATYGSWLLMYDHLQNLHILNPLTLERVDLPHSASIFPNKRNPNFRCNRSACLWIDDITKDYLVVWLIDYKSYFAKKGDDTWLPAGLFWNDQIIYNHKDHKVYQYSSSYLCVWDFASDIPHVDKHHLPVRSTDHQIGDDNRFNLVSHQIVTSLSGEVVLVKIMHHYNLPIWRFRVYELNLLTETLVKIDSLGDAAIILDMSITVVAKDIPGIKKNSIYFSGLDHPTTDPKRKFVYDLNTGAIERLPQCVFSSMLFSDSRWFLPGFKG
ncbi:F-box-like domain superfamily [Arabidopsis suecica]|uniref:F-box-like domain superfamily n=1 Tax=Arabidopsis suecica TaxID=45249 RepID=A0A8T1YLV3_ARASU|nr:F-box-like domain superfamily [Arabidopsis suecica]